MATKSSSSHPFLDPLWRRVLLVAAVCAWAAVEFYNGQQTWGMLFAAMAVYGAYAYLITYVPSDAATPKQPDKSPDT